MPRTSEIDRWHPRLVDYIEVALSDAATESGLTLSDGAWERFCHKASNHIAGAFVKRLKETFT